MYSAPLALVRPPWVVFQPIQHVESTAVTLCERDHFDWPFCLANHCTIRETVVTKASNVVMRAHMENSSHDLSSAHLNLLIQEYFHSDMACQFLNVSLVCLCPNGGGQNNPQSVDYQYWFCFDYR